LTNFLPFNAAFSTRSAFIAVTPGFTISAIPIETVQTNITATVIAGFVVDVGPVKLV